MISDFISSIYEVFDSLPTVLKILLFFIFIVPNMIMVQIVIMPISIFICIFDFIMNLAYYTEFPNEPDILMYIAFFPVFLIWMFGKNVVRNCI